VLADLLQDRVARCVKQGSRRLLLFFELFWFLAIGVLPKTS